MAIFENLIPLVIVGPTMVERDAVFEPGRPIDADLLPDFVIRIAEVGAAIEE